MQADQQLDEANLASDHHPTHRGNLQALWDRIEDLLESVNVQDGRLSGLVQWPELCSRICTACINANATGTHDQPDKVFCTQPSLFDADPDEIKQWSHRQRARSGYPEVVGEITNAVIDFRQTVRSLSHTVNISAEVRAVLNQITAAGGAIQALSQGESDEPVDRKHRIPYRGGEDFYGVNLETFVQGLQSSYRKLPQQTLAGISNFPWTSQAFEEAQDSGNASPGSLRRRDQMQSGLAAGDIEWPISSQLTILSRISPSISRSNEKELL